jgi:hypothetical protein
MKAIFGVPSGASAIAGLVPLPTSSRIQLKFSPGRSGPPPVAVAGGAGAGVASAAGALAAVSVAVATGLGVAACCGVDVGSGICVGTAAGASLDPQARVATADIPASVNTIVLRRITNGKLRSSGLVSRNSAVAAQQR